MKPKTKTAPTHLAINSRSQNKVVPLASHLPRIARIESQAPSPFNRRPGVVQSIYGASAAPALTPEPPPEPVMPDPAILEQARREAEREGLFSAQAKVEAIMERYVDAIARLDSAIKEAMAPRAAEAVDLAILVARELIGQEIMTDRDILVSTLEKAMEPLKEANNLHIRMGAADLVYVMQRRPDLIEAGVKFVEDSSLGVGGCVIETPFAVAEASVETRLQAVRRSLGRLMNANPANTTTSDDKGQAA